MNKCFLILLSIISILTGCWDQNLLVGKKLINGVGFDLIEDNQILVTTRALNIQSKGGGQFDIQDELVQATRPSVSGLRIDIDNKLPGNLDISKAHLIIIGEDFAKNGLHPILEGEFRGKDSYIAAKIVIGKGKASDIISIEPGKSPIAFDILKGLEAAENTNVIPDETIINVWTKIGDSDRRDPILPYLEKIESNKIVIAGVALLNDDKYTGFSLPSEKSTLLLLLMNELKKVSNSAVILNQGKKVQSIAFTTTRMKRNFELEVDKKSRQIICRIDLKLDIRINSYPQEKNKKLNIDKLKNALSTELTKQAKDVTDTLLDANCDALGIGRRIASFHPDIWKEIDWEEEYKYVQFEPNVKVDFINTGSIY
ncbi:Ger(x)C family spore germination protein [Bacillus haimaensis]|uniref:Ger(x)C family spore germination protein n=1 Tax=Bacillus haimaensis TaxID=3160967 RepID=UPI003AA8E257